MPEWRRPLKALEIGKAKLICDGEDVAILSIGHIGNEVVKACLELNSEGIYPAHYDMRFVKPLDCTVLHHVFTKFNTVITVEDGCIQGGMGSAVLEFMADNNYSSRMVRLGIPDKIIEHGEQPELWAECGFDTSGIRSTVEKLVVKRATKTIAS
jgi:1-deoxy-D-xylulose-5-phosphate synthase